MYFDDIVASFVQEKKKAYTPQFRLKKEKSGWRVYDGDTAIAFLYATSFDIWSFSPFEDPILFNEEPAGKVVDLYTVHNTVVNLGAGWPKRWFTAECSNPEEMVKWRWTKKAGAELEAEITGAFGEDRVRWVLRIWYDASWARYRYETTIDAWTVVHTGFEPFNMMLAGALCSCCEDRRWTHSIWEDADNRLQRFVHSNALFSVTDYGDDYGYWRTRNIPYRGGWVANAAHESFNPAVLIRDNNVPMKLATCSQLFDEHVIWNDAGTENLDENGMFHFHMACEFVNIGGALARQLLKKAQDPVRPKTWRKQMVALAFHMGVENDFEEAVDVWQPEDCPLFTLPKATDGPVVWADDEAHSGKRSIRLTNHILNERNELHPAGAVCNVKSHTRYRLSGWIKTKGVDRFARLELASFEYSYDNHIDKAATANVVGTKDWTYVEVELNSDEEAYVMPILRLYGPGSAWFDDLKLVEVAE
ncbi:MAG TPA: hypothetical protein VGM19_03000 [Armatimonadota bacterium]|jgi:hypothetical protein